MRLDQATAADALATHRRQPRRQDRARRRSDRRCCKAVKNAVEIEGARAAHRRDGAAVARFLAWFDREAPRGKLTEIDAVEALESFRRETGVLQGRLVPDHLRRRARTARSCTTASPARPTARIEPGELFLIDSGGQYRDGTTDITRTVAVGAPTAEMRDRFTRVLKGHIAIARVRFPEGTTGAQLDALARHALWEAGLDYDHGTGHGVGSYLSVHEGPARISKLGTVPLERGMILSNEPGYYKTGAYGIRIENLVLVTRGAAGRRRARSRSMRFETLTLAPIDRRLIDRDLLTPEEIAWLDATTPACAATLSPLVDDADRAPGSTRRPGRSRNALSRLVTARQHAPVPLSRCCRLVTTSAPASSLPT